MPTINLNIPTNSRFHSSLNEVDLAVREALIHCMRKADPRDKSGKQDNIAKNENEFLWDHSRVFLTDDLNTKEIMDTFLLRKKINNEENTDFSFPVLAFKEQSIETVFWGTGNRYAQNYIEIPSETKDFEIGDEVIIKRHGPYFSQTATIQNITTSLTEQLYNLSINGKIIQERLPNLKYKNIDFHQQDLKLAGPKIAKVYKAKGIKSTYECAILTDNKDELQYIRDRYLLKIADSNIWFIYYSPTINSNNQIYTVFEIPNIDKYPSNEDRLNGEGWIYGSAFKINVWAALTDEPIDANYIEQIRLTIEDEAKSFYNRHIIS